MEGVATPGRDALELIQDTAVKAAGAKAKVHVLSLEEEPEGYYGVVDGDGKLQVREANPEPRNHRLASVDDVAAFADHAKEKLKGDPTIWYNEKQVVVLVNDTPDSNRRDRCTVELTPTPQYSALKNPQRHGQKEFVQLLRRVFFDALGENGPTLIKMVRLISFNNATSGHGKVEHGRESMGREIEAEVRSDAGGTIPEDVIVSLRLFTDKALDQRYDVRCMLDIEPRDATFALIPYPQQLENALRSQMDRLHSILESDTGGAIFYGAP